MSASITPKQFSADIGTPGCFSFSLSFSRQRERERERERDKIEERVSKASPLQITYTRIYFGTRILTSTWWL